MQRFSSPFAGALYAVPREKEAAVPSQGVLLPLLAVLRPLRPVFHSKFWPRWRLLPLGRKSRALRGGIGL